MIPDALRRFRVQVSLRLALVAGVAIALTWAAVRTGRYELLLLAAGLLVFLAFSLIRYVEKTMRDVLHFLEAVRYGDFSQRMTSGGRGGLSERLSDAFEEVMVEFRRIRAEREEQVRYLQNVVQHVGIALIAFREGGHVELMNAAARRLLGVASVRHIRALETFSQPLVEALLRLKAGEQALVPVEREDNSYQLSVYATQYRMRGELHTLVSLQDIRQALEEKEMEAWQQLTRVLTHEIMNSVAPIASVAATANGLLASRDGADPDGVVDDVHEALAVIERRSKALVHFVDAYRSFTKIPPPQYRMIRVDDLFGGVRQLVAAQARRQSASVSLSVEPPDLTLAADPDLIEQVLINLLLNALQAVDGRPEGHIQLRAAQSGSGLPVIQVADNGPGIAPDVQERIFLPFFTTREDGTGIGLSLSRQIMRLHGGTLTVHARPGEETVFTLRF